MNKTLQNILSFFRRKALSLSLVLLYLLLSFNSMAGEIQSMRIGQGVGNVRIVFDADSSFEYKAFLLSSPSRLVVDVYNIDVDPKIEKQVAKNNIISSTRLGNVDNSAKRIVFDLAKPAIIKKAFMLAPQSNFGWRFVIDVAIASEREFKGKVGTGYAFTSSDNPKAYAKKSRSSSDKAKPKKSAQKVIVLDPGHGGKEGGEVFFVVPQMGGYLADPDVFVDVPVEVIQDFPLKIVLFHYGLGGGAFPQALVLQQAEHHHGVRRGNVGVVIKAVVFEQQPHLIPDHSGVV